MRRTPTAKDHGLTIYCDNCKKDISGAKRLFEYRVIGKLFIFCGAVCRRNKVREL